MIQFDITPSLSVRKLDIFWETRSKQLDEIYYNLDFLIKISKEDILEKNEIIDCIIKSKFFILRNSKKFQKLNALKNGDIISYFDDLKFAVEQTRN
jgi:hypothetical protein